MTLEEVRKHWADLSTEPFEIFPPPRGIEHNEFRTLDFTDTALKIKNTKTEVERCLEFNLIEVIGLGTPHVLKTVRQVAVYGSNLI
jgi:hypothetical protein